MSRLQRREGHCTAGGTRCRERLERRHDGDGDAVTVNRTGHTRHSIRVQMDAIYNAFGVTTAPKRVVVFGIDGSGKTSVLERIKDAYMDVTGLRPEQIIPTVGMNIAKVPYGRLPYACTFWDLGGAIALRGIWNNYFKDADAAAYVVDAASEESLEEAMVELERALNNAAFPRTIPIVILANKNDLSGPEGVEMVRAASRDVFASARVAPNARVFPTDARTGVGIKPAIEWLIGELVPTNASLFTLL